MQILTITDLDEHKMHSLALTKCIYIYILLHLFMFSLSLIGIFNKKIILRCTIDLKQYQFVRNNKNKHDEEKIQLNLPEIHS